MAVPATMVYFTLYDQLKYAMGFREGEHSTRFIPLLAGSTARGRNTTKIEFIRNASFQEIPRFSDFFRFLMLLYDLKMAFFDLKWLFSTLKK